MTNENKSNFLKDEIQFFCEEARQKNKYIEMLCKDRAKSLHMPNEDAQNETDLSSLMNTIRDQKSCDKWDVARASVTSV